MTNPTQEDLLRALADAMFNETYYRRRADRLRAVDLAMRCVTAVASVGTVTVLLSQLGAPWQISIAGVAAAFGAVSPVLRLDDGARKWSELASRWTEVAGGLRQLDKGVVDEADRAKEFCRLVKSSESLQREDITGRRDSLARSSQQEVLRQLKGRFA